MIEIIGAPFDLAGLRPGSRLGPPAIRLAGIDKTLRELGLEVEDLGDLAFVPESDTEGAIRFVPEALPSILEGRAAVKEIIGRGNFPLVLGGDHSLSMGAVSGALEAFDGDLALLWMDAHADLNTPATTPSGRLHGMPVAALLGLPSGVQGPQDEDWRKLLPPIPLRSDCLAHFGIRELDPGEQAALRRMPEGYTATMHELDRHGIVRALQRFDKWMRKIGVTHLWISFDVDLLDPVLAPGTGTAVRGGLTYREAHLVAELLRELLDTPACPYRLAGLDIVETNPLFDRFNETAITVVEWVASLFGKTILGK
jgi:arginase